LSDLFLKIYDETGYTCLKVKKTAKFWGWRFFVFSCFGVFGRVALGFVCTEKQKTRMFRKPG